MKKKCCTLLSVLLTLLSASSCTQAKVRQYTVRAVQEYPHDRAAYTQGLFFEDGQLYESTGQYGSSSFRKVELNTGKPLIQIDFSKKYFIEGSVILDGELYILTWTSRVAFKYDAATLEYRSTSRYPREGWGLTTDGKRLIASDGTSNLYFLDKNFAVKKTLKVTMEGRPVRYLNELEWIDGKIWANVYLTDLIVVINPSDGRVEGRIDCTGLLPDRLREAETDVLNGIACREGRVYLTGKNWPRLYEVEIIEK